MDATAVVYVVNSRVVLSSVVWKKSDVLSLKGVLGSSLSQNSMDLSSDVYTGKARYSSSYVDLCQWRCLHPVKE